MNIFQRLKWRVMWASLLTVLAFALMQPLTLMTGIPEIARLLPALAVLFWIKISLVVSRIVFKPKLDFQDIAAKAVEEGYSSSIAWLLAIEHLLYVGAMLWVIFAT